MGVFAKLKAKVRAAAASPKPGKKMSKSQKAGNTLSAASKQVKANVEKEFDDIRSYNKRMKAEGRYNFKSAGNLTPEARMKTKVKAQTHRYEGTASGGKIQRPTQEGKFFIETSPEIVYPDKYARQNGKVVNKSTGKVRRNNGAFMRATASAS